MIDIRIYYDTHGFTCLLWKCTDCGLEWRDLPGMLRAECPRCELAGARADWVKSMIDKEAVANGHPVGAPSA